MGASTPLCQPALAAHSLTATTAGQRAMVSRHAWIETLLPLCPRPAPRDPLARVRSPLAQLGADRLTVRRSSYAYAAQRATLGSNSNPKTTSPSSYKRFASSLSLTRFLSWRRHRIRVGSSQRPHRASSGGLLGKLTHSAAAHRYSRPQTRSIRTRSPCRTSLGAERTSSRASPETSRPSGSGPLPTCCVCCLLVKCPAHSAHR
jgi:hypothetical protein